MRTKFVFAAVVASSLLLTGCGKKPTPTATGPTPRARKVDINVNQEPLENRPYVRLTPSADGHTIVMDVVEVKKKAADLEYEIEYNSGSLLQGAFGQTSLSSLPVSKNILLGSCSTGGKCTYNTDVTGGTLTLRFGSPDYTLKQDWSFVEMKKGVTTFTSRDGKLAADASKAKIKATDVIVYQTPGLPGQAPGTVVTGPYTVAANGAITGSVALTFRVGSDVSAATIYGYDGKQWKSLSTKLADGQATTNGDLMDAYVVVKK